MKIRIKNNTIRYRLDKKDIENLDKNGICEEKTLIGENYLKFSIKIRTYEPINVDLTPFKVATSINSESFRQIMNGSAAGIEFSVRNPDNSELKILVERDFKCLVPRGEDDRHAFENPLEGKASC